MHATDKMFDKICLKAIKDTFVSNMWSVTRGWGRGGGVLSFLLRGNIQQKRKFQTFGLAERPSPQFVPLVEHTDLSAWKNLKKMLRLLTDMILKEYFFPKQQICDM